jgi:hypothetical protein
MLRLELAALNLDDDVTLQARVIKQQVNEELIARDFQPELPPHIGKAGTQLDQETGDMANQRVFDFALMGIVSKAEEVEQIRVFQRFQRQRRIRRWQLLGEIGNRRALARM